MTSPPYFLWVALIADEGGTGGIASRSIFSISCMNSVER